MKGADTDMKRKEVKGNPKKLPDMTRKGNEVQIRELAAIQGKGNDRTKRAGRPVTGCVALACKSGYASLG